MLFRSNRSSQQRLCHLVRLVLKSRRRSLWIQLLTTHRRESNAIIYYLIEKYDTTHRISVESLEDKAIQQRWLYFQASGQGCVLFLRVHVTLTLTIIVSQPILRSIRVVRLGRSSRATQPRRRGALPEGDPSCLWRARRASL